MSLNLSGNYIGRSGGFLYLEFVRDSLNAIEGRSTNKTSLYRSAVEHGALEKKSEIVIRKISQALNTIGNRQGYKRHKIKEESGYFFKKLTQ